MDLEDLVSRNKWQDEEDDDEVKDNWEDEDEEPPKPVSTDPKPSGGIRNKGKTAAKIKEASNASGSNNKPLTPQELREKKLQEEKAQRESDLKLTKQMLGMEDKDIALEFTLDTKEDFDKFHRNLVHKLWCYDKSPNYYLLIEKLFRDLCVPLEADELKNLSSTVNALFNEKVKTSKAKPKKKSTKGLALKMERNNLDRNDDDGIYDPLDDIM